MSEETGAGVGLYRQLVDSIALHGDKAVGGIAMLVEMGAPVACPAKARAGKDKLAASALHVAIEKGAMKCVEALLATNQCDLQVRDDQGKTPLHVAIEAGHTEIAKQLIAAVKAQKVVRASDQPIDAVDYAGDAALHVAARKGLIDVVSTLIEAGATVDAPNMFRKTALCDAPAEVATVLLASGANVNAADAVDCGPAHYAAYRGDVEALRVLVAGGAKNRLAAGGAQAALNFIAACKEKRVDVQLPPGVTEDKALEAVLKAYDTAKKSSPRSAVAHLSAAVAASVGAAEAKVAAHLTSVEDAAAARYAPAV